MKRTFATLTMLVAGILTVSLPNGALAELTFGEWATAEGYPPPGPEDWVCHADEMGITSLDGVSSYTNLEELRLGSNQIASLAPDQFKGLTTLQWLDLDSNQISSLHPDQFQGLTALSWLDLDNNQISSLAPNQFEDLSNLTSLHLNSNQISSLAANQFQGLANLYWLHLYHNQISSLAPNQFEDLTNLSTLHLQNNQLSSLAPDQFKGLTKLNEVSIAANQILSLAPNQFEDLTNLQRLEISRNQISSLSDNQFQGLTKLRILQLYKNQISSLNPNQFQGLSELDKLYLSFNQIVSLDLTGFEATELTDFTVYDNPITEVILADATLSQTTLDTLMTGHQTNDGANGIAEIPGIASVDFTAADMAGVDQFDTMFGMADLQTLILTDVLFSEAIVADGYAEVWDLVSALDSKRLDALTVDQGLYTAMQTNLDAWDARPGNVLTVVPEPSTLALLAVAGLALLLWRKKATSR